MLDKNKINFETTSSSDVLLGLKTDKEKGLSDKEAKERLAKYGENKLVEQKRKSWIKIFFEQMANPMIYILFAAVAITIGVSIYESTKNGWNFLKVGDWPDVIIILAVIILNSVIGTVQEVKADNSLDALKKLSSPESTVIREGKRIKIKSSELVIGDIVVLEEGDTIGADLRLIESYNLKCDESSLTGESVPVEKDANVVLSDKVAIGDRINMAYMSTPVSYGRGLGVVVATGMETQIGQIANALEEEKEEETPLQKVLAKLSKFLGILTICIIIFVLAIDIIWIFVKGEGSQVEAWIESVLGAIALAVAAIPEGLAAVVTIVLSIGVQRMVKVNTIVKKLPSVETLGAVSIVCSDKTGTLTQNKMTVVEAYANGNHYTSNDFNKNNKDNELILLAQGMSLCSNATVDEGLYGDPTEIALVAFANEFNLHKKDLENKSPRINELPFDSVRKMMSTMHKIESKNIVFTKGALDSILARTSFILENGKKRKIEKSDIDNIYKINSEYSYKALRVLALAYSEENEIKESELIFVGLVAMIDPARKEAKPAVMQFKNAGITTIMITGDHKDTAFAIAKELGIAENIDQCVMGTELDNLNETELRELVKHTRVFARVSPENKTSIVKAFKANGHICAMTGDGVNDAPSLKAADIGIAMGITGTDVAKGAADMVLADDNFATIVNAVEEGRKIYDNVCKVIQFQLSTNLSEVIIMFVSSLFHFTLLNPVHLLWTNMVTDSLPGLALGMEKAEGDIMRRKPRNSSDGVFAHGAGFDMAWQGIYLAFIELAAYFIGLYLEKGTIKGFFGGEECINAIAMAFLTVNFCEIVCAINMRSQKKSIFSKNMIKNFNWWLAGSTIITVGLTVAAVYIPGFCELFGIIPGTFQLEELIICIVLSISVFPVFEIGKSLRNSVRKRHDY